MDDKIIVTNKRVLRKKYGASGLRAIQASLATLTSADKPRGIKTRTIYLDDAAAMKKVRGKAVTNAADPRQNKAAVDAIFKAVNPDYLMILGAADVVPHQDLDNPMLSPDDDDAHAWSDLPYACDAAYSRDPAQFVGPTRVVGRLPDLTGAPEPSHIIALLNTAAAYSRRPLGDYMRYFGLSAEVWQGSTRMSLNNVFGNGDNLLLAPSAGPAYPGGELGARAHFINCHGALAQPEFYGQRGSSYPVSLTTTTAGGRITEGTVAAAECCYGAELYNAAVLGLDMPICQSYLAQGAYGYLGSTTIAYGPADENGAADLICQYFLLSVLDGASVGRAALVARQQFVQHVAQMDPADLKTLAQFCLYGDPSVHPVDVPTPTGVPKGVASADAMRYFRAERRANMKTVGEFLKRTKPTASKRVSDAKVSGSVKTALSNIAALAGLKPTQPYAAFAVKGAAKQPGKPAKVAGAISRYHLTVGVPEEASSPTVKVAVGVAVLAKEVAGRIVGYRIYHQR